MIQTITESYAVGLLGLAVGIMIGFAAWDFLSRKRRRDMFREMDRLKSTAAREATRAEDLSAKVDYLISDQHRLEAELELRDIERQRLLASMAAPPPRTVGELEDKEGRAHRIEIHVSETTIDLRDPSELQRVEGIGPQIADLLHEAGIHSLHALSELDPEDLTQILEDGGPHFRMHDPSTWPDQAQSLNGSHH